MKISDLCLQHLKGKKFSTGFITDFIFEESDSQYLSRVDLLQNICKDKKIIHIGCVDHDPSVMEQKAPKGKWLHKTLTDITEQCIGVDIAAEGIAHLHSIGCTNVICADITSPPPILLEQQWDYIAIPEVLEHIGNPVDFLSKIRTAMKDNARAIVLTVPNAFSLENFKLAKKNKEAINSDHRFWFTPFTLAKVVIDAGFTIEHMQMCKTGKVNRQSIIRNSYFQSKPMLRNNILMVASF